MTDYCERHKIMWALDPSAAMPTEEDLEKLPIEHSPKEKEGNEEAKDGKKGLTQKQFPFRLRVTDLKTGDPIEIKDRLKK